MREVHLNLDPYSYSITIDQNILGNLGQWIVPETKSDKVAVVTDEVVSKLYGDIVLKSLRDFEFDVRMIQVPSGEENKSLTWFSKIHDSLIDHQMDRNSTLIAFGGGVIGDLSGFVAATFMRGISWIQVPTTLLAQVDASVGGKTAINHSKGKNMVGAFHQPSLVLIDVDTLHDLAERDVVSGLAEIIKHGVIMNEPLFSLIEKNLTKILRLVPEVLIEIIAESCANKAYVVENDEKENGLRSTLNYGHTFAHALEVLTDYNTFRHGEAVAVGMNCAAQLSVHLGMLDPCELDRQNTLLQNAGLPIQIPRIQSEKFLEAMYLDKKTSHGKLKLILIEEIGKVKIRTGIPDNEILTVIEKCTTN